MNYDFQTILNQIILPAMNQTFFMVIATAILSTVLGFVLAIAVLITDVDGLHPIPWLNRILSTFINVVRSFPFIILMVSIIPLTRLIAGTSIGTRAAIVPLTFAATPFMARLFFNNFKEVTPNLIEAAKSFGLSDMHIIRYVIIKESVPALIQSITLAIISILSSSAMAGAIGGGGLGSVAMTYGYQNFNDTIMYGTVVILIVIVQIIQFIGDRFYNRMR